ncbi:uncharacterized protein hivep2b [Diretmus argenteus]
MESLETTAGVKSSTEGRDRDVAPKKCTSEPTAVRTKRSPSVELEGKRWHRQLQEGQSRNTCGFKEMPDSGKSQQLEDQHSQPHATSHQDYELSSYPLQGAKPFPIGRQKAVGHLVCAQSPGGSGSTSHRKSPSLPEVLQQCSHPGMDQLSETVCKMEQKQQKPGKYVCDYCGRACAKPSVLKKHIRSHTGERPYPCIPCGFSFKTKSNLYKHRKSHAHSVKAGTVPFSELGSYNANTDQGSFEGEGELYSDAEQSTDTDEDTLNDPLLLLDSPVEGSDSTAVKVLNLIAQKKGVTLMSAHDGSPQLQEINAPPATAQACRAIQSSAIKQRLALRLSEKRSSDSDQNLSLPSQSSKGSTDSGYFSRSESAEHQTGPPNTNAKSYQEIMFGKCYRPSPKQATAFVTCSTDSTDYTVKRSEKGVSRVFTQEKDIVESIKINTKSFIKEETKEPQLDSGSDVGPLVRSNSMPTSSAVCLSMPQALRGSHSFDERASPGGMRRLRRQAAFELPAHDSHTDSDSHAKMTESGISPSAVEMENYPTAASNLSHQRHAMELATRKRRKEKREEEDLPGQYEAHHEQCEEMFDTTKDYDSKQVSQGALGIIALGKVHSYTSMQLDRCDMEISVSPDVSGRKTLGNVISVIQHTNSINRPHAEQPESYKYHGQRQESISSFQAMEPTEAYEMERSDSRLGQSFQIGPKLVRQSNIQVPEIRVTVEPDSPEKAPEVQVKEPERHVEEFQWPQRSETLAQFPPEKLPPKKKRLRLADIEHSSGESSFESACTSLSRSPSQDSNLSYSSTFSFDREESFKSVSPARQDEFGKPLELLAVPGSGHSLSVLNQRQQHEMRRSSSEQAPCNLRKEFPEVRSISFDYGSLSPASKVRHADISTGHSAGKERRRGNLVRQESLNMDTELTQVPPQMFPQYLPFTAAAVLPQALPIFATGNTYPQLSHPSLLVPVRIQTHVPSYGSITYTTVSQMFDNQYDSVSSTTAISQNQISRLSGNLDSPNVLGYTRTHLTHTLDVEALDLSSAKLKTGIPLSLTSRTISTTNASSGGANKRMLSPPSSLDPFMEVKQQKRVKEEKMFGQIVEELSAVELGKCNLAEEKGHRSEIQGTSIPHAQDDISKFVTLQKKVTETTDRSVESAMESSSLESGTPPYSMISVSEVKELGTENRVQMDMVAQLVTSQDILISDSEHSESRQLSQFPSLRTTTGVSWCYLNYTKPCNSHSRNTPFSSVYATWCVSSHNPNPPDLSTSAALALLRSKQRGDKVIYTVAAMCQPGAGKLVSSLILWRQTMEQLQRKPELKEVDITYGKKVKDSSCRLKTAKDEWKEREASTTQTVPTRIKIFEGGYKSNEDYVYVRGRGRGKYICEECGIRCKKPSMLKKHIRTHTDVRPYICRVCNFAFKTKGNLTKHMKSKAHMKKCLELGVSVTVDDTEILEHDEIQSKTGVAGSTKHQFSDADDSDGMDEDEIDEDDDEDDEYEGDSTPKLRSRSASPQSCGGTPLSVTATAAIHGCSLTSLPGAEGRHQASGRRTGSDLRTVLITEQRQRSVDEDSLTMLSPEQSCFLFDPYSSCLLSPGWESPIREPSPSRLRYPSPRRELSPRGRSSPRWDTSPLRPTSPSFTPIQHLSPVSIERPLSPGTELSGKRESSVRGRQRVVLRAVSPRRGSHQHRGTSDKGRHHQAKVDHHQQGAFEMELDQRSSLASSLPSAASSHHQNILSHLPLHSQQRAQSLLPMVPIGGIQMLHSPPSSSTDVTPSSALSPQSSESQRCSSGEGSVHGPETGGEDFRGQQQDQLSSHQAAQGSQEKSLDPGVRDSGQEENVQTCMKAIASLKITTEDPH